MAISITVPRLGWSMEEGTFVEWLKADGDRVKPGEPLFVLESEKAAENIEALDAGVLRIPPDGPAPGAVVKVGQVLAFLTAEGEAAPALSPPQPSRGMNEAKPTGGPRDSLRPSRALSAPGRSSPRARRVARELGVDWTGLTGSGSTGRIRERDVRAAAAPQEGRLIPHTSVRRAIAARMVAGVTQTAPVTLHTKADATKLVAWREQQRRTSPTNASSPGMTDVVLKLTALALREHPRLQGQWRDDGIVIPAAIHVAFAVDTEAGLLAPVIRDADKLTLAALAAQRRALTERASAGTPNADDLRGATFTISNLGMFGIDAFTPIISLPQCAVLGVGRIVREPAVVDERIVPRDVLTLSLTFDHRIVDGAPAARFLDTLRQALEQLAAV